MQYIEESLYEGGHCYSNNLKDLFRIIFNVGQMQYTKTKKTFEEGTLRRFLNVPKQPKKQLLPKGLWGCSPLRKRFIRELLAELRMPSDWPPFGDDLVDAKADVRICIIMSCICRVYVDVYMSCICLVDVLYMSCICHVYVLYMSYICPIYVTHLFDLYMSCICPVYVLYVSYICHTFI
jgi:hypothetical protein